MPIFIGVDPGASGGISRITTGHERDPASQHLGRVVTVTITPMPDTPQDIWNSFPKILCHPTFAVLEKVQGYIGPQKTPKGGEPGRQPGSSMFKFGASYGRLQMALTAAGIPFVEVTPQKWQRALGIPPRNKAKETKYQFKKRLKEFAQKLFPFACITQDTADSLLVAEYARRHYYSVMKP
jgi:hypothetical protein